MARAAAAVRASAGDAPPVPRADDLGSCRDDRRPPGAFVVTHAVARLCPSGSLPGSGPSLGSTLSERREYLLRRPVGRRRAGRPRGSMPRSMTGMPGARTPRHGSRRPPPAPPNRHPPSRPCRSLNRTPGPPRVPGSGRRERSRPRRSPAARRDLVSDTASGGLPRASDRRGPVPLRACHRRWRAGDPCPIGEREGRGRSRRGIAPATIRRGASSRRCTSSPTDAAPRPHAAPGGRPGPATRGPARGH